MSILLNIEEVEKGNSKTINWYKSNLTFEFTHEVQLRVHFNNVIEWILTKNPSSVSKMFISERRTLSSFLKEKLLVKFSRQHHAPMEINFANNQHKFDSRTTSVLYILNDWLFAFCFILLTLHSALHKINL